LSEEQDIQEALDLLREVFEAQTLCLKDHEDFVEIGEGKIKTFVKPQEN
jgi:hypothetical protein